MKLLCFSDSHGRVSPMKTALRRNPDADAVIFLGDGLSDAEEVADGDLVAGVRRPWFCVRGNCDFRSTFFGEEVPKTGTLTFEGVRIVYTHGDLYGVKYGQGGLDLLAKNKDADIILFGHTHAPIEIYGNGGEKPCYYFNPGSIGAPGTGKFSFGVVTVKDGNILLSHGTVEEF